MKHRPVTTGPAYLSTNRVSRMFTVLARAGMLGASSRPVAARAQRRRRRRGISPVGDGVSSIKVSGTERDIPPAAMPVGLTDVSYISRGMVSSPRCRDAFFSRSRRLTRLRSGYIVAS